jgi:tetratricopeptide (TPR) repeat protein
LGLEPPPASDAPVIAPPEKDSRPRVPEASEPEPIALPSTVPSDAGEPFFIPRGDDLADAEARIAAGHLQENNWFEPEIDSAIALPARQSAPPTPAVPMPRAETRPAVPPPVETPANYMFADLIAEVNALTDRGIAREDFETHFSLGIAFREMGLVEDAIREFQSAVKVLSPEKSSKEFIQCCGMLSTCFLEKDMPRSAIRWCQTGLSHKEISSHEAMALRYDMAVAHSSAGEAHRALECLAMIFGVDPSYRDVAQRIDDLKSGLERHAP